MGQAAAAAAVPRRRIRRHIGSKCRRSRTAFTVTNSRNGFSKTYTKRTQPHAQARPWENGHGIYIPLLAAATAFAGTTVIARQAARTRSQPGAAPAAQQAPQDAARGTRRGRGGPQASPFSTPPLRVFIYAGLKTHSEGQHDYPQFLADWSKLLMSRNAIVDGGLHFPSAKELGASDVVIMYKGDAGYLSMETRANSLTRACDRAAGS